MKKERREWRKIGRIMVGIGIIIMQIEMKGKEKEKLRRREIIKVIVDYMQSDKVKDYIIEEMMKWILN